MYYVFNNGVLKDGVRIIDEDVYNLMLCCDGKSIDMLLTAKFCR